MLKRNHSLQLPSFTILFLFFTTPFLFFPTLPTSAAKPKVPSDAQALLDFKSKADLHNLLWFNASSICKWQGVGCSSKNDRVERLILESLNLGGIFAPKSLTRLDQLRVLSLQNNSLTGPVPDLTGLINLKVLFLDHNSFSGSFPPSVASLHRLRTVDLGYNNFTGELPSWLTRLDRLYYLRVEFNRFNGTIPSLNQSSLSYFNVSGNNLTGPIPVTPALSQFGASAFAENPGLCGEIIHKECKSSKLPFFSPTASPDSDPPRPHERGIGDQNAELQGVDVNPQGEKRRHYKNTAVGLSFLAGILVLIGALFCFIFAIRRQRKKKHYQFDQTMAEDSLAAADAAEVMRIEQEREEKVKKVQEEVTKSGNLLFCAGEAQLYSLDQLMRASAELLGRGNLGTTYKAVLDNRLIVCVKRLDASKICVGKDGFERHMESVGGLRHPNLVPLRAYFHAKEERLLVYDYQPNGSLYSLIHGSKSSRAKPLHWTSCLKITEDVAQGISYIHQAWRLVHGNIKSSNVLLGSDFEACVTDYCLTPLSNSCSIEDDIDPNNTAGYRAPELRKSNDPQPTPKSDVYAFGVLLLELLTGKPPSQHPYLTPKDIVKWVRSTREVEDGGEEENRLAMLLEVAIACSVASADQRPTMWQVLKMLQEIKEAVFMEDSDELDPPQHVPLS